MTRTAFFAAIAAFFGARAHAQVKEHVPCWGLVDKNGFCKVGPVFSEGYIVAARPANGQCPVCRTMAAPFKPTDEEYGVPAKPHWTAEGHWIIPNNSRTVTCAHCRVKFEQDAEPTP